MSQEVIQYSGSPKVSIGIPTRNRCEYLRFALESAASQTYPNLEVVVSDNCSDDGTRDYLSTLTDPRIKVLLHKENLGMVGNFNACLFGASGEFFLLLSDDDLLEPNAIDLLVRPFLSDRSGSFGMSWCPCTIIDTDGRTMWKTEGGPPEEPPVSLLRGLFDGHRGTRLSSILIRRADSLELHGYDEVRHGVLCDTGNWGRIALQYPLVACIGEPLVKYRVHPASETQVANSADWQAYIRNIHEDYLDILEKRGDGASADRLRGGFNHHLANITVTVLLRFVGRPGWIVLCLEEFWRSRRFMITPFVFRRILWDGWKLLKIRPPRSRQ